MSRWLIAALMVSLPAMAQTLPETYNLRVSPQDLITIQQGLNVAIQQGQTSALLAQKLTEQARDQTELWRQSHPETTK